MVPAGAPPEAFIEALSGYRSTDDGVLQEITDTETAALRAQLRASAEKTHRSGDRLITWWLTTPQDHRLLTGDKLTRRETRGSGTRQGDMARNLERLRARSRACGFVSRDGKRNP